MEILQCPHCHTRVCPSPDAICPQCQGDVNGLRAPPRPAGALYAKKCPKCASTEFRPIRSDALITFKDDRVCLQCSTTYRLPTPTWAAVVMIVVGLVLVIGLGCSALMRVLRADASSLGLILEIPLILLGIAATISGLRALWRKPSP